MKSLLLALLCAPLLTGCLSAPLETTVVPVDLQGWEGRGVDLGRGRGTITELHPPGESLDDWTQLVTLQFLEGSERSPREAMDVLRSAMQARASADVSVTWRVLDETDTSITYEWSIAGSREHADQVELARLLEGQDGLHRVAFAKHGVAFSAEERARWRAALAGAEVVKEGEPVALDAD